MIGGWWELVAVVVLGLVINECGELSPWLARKLIRWAARVRYPTRVEELTALIAERPGKLFKLVTASGFACAALRYRVMHRKTVPVHSVTSRFWIGFGSALVAGVVMTGEIVLMGVIIGDMLELFVIIILGVIAAFTTAAELLVLTRLPAGQATAIVSFALVLIFTVLWNSNRMLIPMLIPLGGMAVAAGVSAACAIRLGNRLRLPVIAASSTILGGGLLTCSVIWTTSTSASQNIDMLVELLGFGFACGFSVGVGVLLWQVLCSRRLSRFSSERVSRTAA